MVDLGSQLERMNVPSPSEKRNNNVTWLQDGDIVLTEGGDHRLKLGRWVHLARTVM